MKGSRETGRLRGNVAVSEDWREEGGAVTGRGRGSGGKAPRAVCAPVFVPQTKLHTISSVFASTT